MNTFIKLSLQSYIHWRLCQMRVNVGDKVLFGEKEYKVIHIYASNFCEIRENGTFRTILVHINQIELV